MSRAFRERCNSTSTASFGMALNSGRGVYSATNDAAHCGQWLVPSRFHSLETRGLSTGIANAERGAPGSSADWKPSGSMLEGDVQRRMYSESGFLNVFERQWDGAPDPAHAYSALDAYLHRLR